MTVYWPVHDALREALLPMIERELKRDVPELVAIVPASSMGEADAILACGALLSMKIEEADGWLRITIPGRQTATFLNPLDPDNWFKAPPPPPDGGPA